LYSKYTDFKISNKAHDNSFDDIFETQRLQKHEILSLTIPEKIKLEISSNIYSIVMGKCFKINISGFVLNNIKAEENSNLENDEYNITINGLLVKNGKIIYTFIWIIPEKGYNIGLSQHWYTSNYYGSCEGCDALMAATKSKTVDDLFTLCLHLMQKLKRMDGKIPEVL